MASISESLNKLTIFYSLTTKKPKVYCTGIQTMDYFGEDKHDYNYGVLVTDYDEFIINNFNNLIVENGTLIFKNDNYIMKRRNL